MTKNLMQWMRGLISGPPRPRLPLDVRIEALAAEWRVEPAIAWRLIQSYALQSLMSMEAAVDALQGLGYEDAQVQVGEG